MSNISKNCSEFVLKSQHFHTYAQNIATYISINMLLRREDM